MYIVFVILFFINLLSALGIRMLVDSDGTNRYLKSRMVRIVLLIPPVSIVIIMGTFVFAVLYTLYDLIVDYLE